MKFLRYISFFVLIICLRSVAYAGDHEVSHKARVMIPEVAMLALHNGGSQGVQFSVGAPNTAGDQVHLQSVDQSSVWLNYSSVLGNIPEGIALKVKTGQNAQIGIGETGTSNGIIHLSNNPSDIISGIGSCYTGHGINKGQQLTYELEINNDQFYHNNELNDLRLSIVYTLTDDN